MNNESVVIQNTPFELSIIDHIDGFQYKSSLKFGVDLNINQAIEDLMKEHQRVVMGEGR